jgi:hypothetical protein
MLGQIMVAWGRLEGHVIGAVAMIHNIPGASAGRITLPLHWEERLKLWDYAFTNVSVLQPHQDRAIKLLQEVVAEAQDRNLVAHGIWDEFVTGSSEPTIKVKTIKAQKRKKSDQFLTIDVTTLEVTLSMLRSALAKANQLNAELAEFTNFLSSLRPIPLGAEIV